MSRGLALCVASQPVRGPLPNDMLGSVTLDLDSVEGGRITVGGLDPRRGYLLAGWVRRGPLAREDVRTTLLDHENEAMPESSSHGPTSTASHEIIGNLMTKMTELLEATLANQRGERTHNSSNDEALEQFLRFQPPKFHGKVEQEAKAELFLE
ncbi:hypothetical protein M9H77_22946 [Catharanthus roseus]|uniref:Uncharacterized protein n=1 Tax=Catharanthus roseus TaxID=4058 RepID=A0ACC0AVY4_CATRO|nr:hypothetical protein M9H77_22946 [Catharanthus roseus]